jgi:hypothetical protein
MKQDRRFYVGSASFAATLAEGRGLMTFNQALKKARTVVEHGDRDEATVVEVIRLIRKQAAPVQIDFFEDEELADKCE